MIGAFIGLAFLVALGFGAVLLTLGRLRQQNETTHERLDRAALDILAALPRKRVRRAKAGGVS